MITKNEVLLAQLLLTPPRSEDGSLLLGGFPASALAASYDTPLIVIDTEVLDERVEALTSIAQRFDIDVAYAAKALLITALAKRLRSTALGLDCCSLGELLTAEAAGFPASRMYLHGCGKTNAELQAVVDGRVARTVVDGFDELYRLAAISRADTAVRVVLRVNTGIEAHTHEFVRTGGENTKFGFALDELDAAYAAIAAEPGLCLIGLHAHIGSQIVDEEPFIANLDVLMEQYIRAHKSNMTTLCDIIVGGGFGVPMHPDEISERLDSEKVLRMIAARAKELASAAAVPPPQLGVEPGRAIIAEAGTTLYRVLAIKRQGQRRYAIVDGGMTDNPRPALYGSYHHPQLASRDSHAAPELFSICGRACENDQLVDANLPGDLRVGDLLAMRVTGAYTYSMASNYNRFSRPALVFAGAGEHALVARREAPQELLRYDI